jgi:hypothetical protein
MAFLFRWIIGILKNNTHILNRTRSCIYDVCQFHQLKKKASRFREAFNLYTQSGNHYAAHAFKGHPVRTGRVYQFHQAKKQKKPPKLGKLSIYVLRAGIEPARL